MTRHLGTLLAGSTLLLFGATWVEGRTPQKEPQPEQAPRGFDQIRPGIANGNLETIEVGPGAKKRKVVIYTPPNYDKQKRHAVLYLLHGKKQDEKSWTNGVSGGAAAAILDNLYADKKLVPMIVVMPNSTMTSVGGDAVVAFANTLFKDIMPAVESKYSIQQDSGHRALAGVEMGGGAAVRHGLGNMDKIAWIGGFSSASLQLPKNVVADSEDVNKKCKLLYISCGDSFNENLFASNKSFHEALLKTKVRHIWNVYPNGEHNFQVWKNDLYLFSQMLFKEKK